MSRNILVVIDMQNDFVTGSLKNEEAQKIVPNIKKKIEKCIEDGWEIVYTQDTHDMDAYQNTEEGKNLPIAHCLLGTEGWAIVPELQAVLHEHGSAFLKDTFGSTALGGYVASKRPEIVEFVGVCTDICVVSNALLVRTFAAGAHVVVDPECCAGTTKEAHEAALRTMKSCQVEVKTEKN